MSARYFLDTNIFVYCFDRVDRRKQRCAEVLVGTALEDHLGIISSQVLQEFLNVATRKFTRTMTPGECRAYMDTVLSPLCEVFPSFALYEQALSVHSDTGFSFYDSLIVAAALEGQCRWLYSEDLQAGRKIRGLTILNPFTQEQQADR